MIFNIIINIFEYFVKSIKISSGNRKLTELLFENLKERKTFFKLKNKESENKIDDSNINSSEPKRKSYYDKNLNDYSLAQLKNQNNINIIGKKDTQNLDIFSIGKVPVKSKFQSDNKLMTLNKVNKDSNKDNTKINTIFVPNDTSLNLPFSDLNTKNGNRELKDKNRQLLKTFLRTQYIRKSLFPFKYYFNFH